jgi:peptidoglycan L-alanyl-D-glutamate endopeptidase CwlK
MNMNMNMNMNTFDERTEKNLATLNPKVQEMARRFLAEAAASLRSSGIVVKVISGTRTYAEQDALYAKGRTKPGPKVTNARGGYSNHNFSVAFDIGLFRGAVYLGESPLYRQLMPIGERHGLEAGGRWKSFPDEPHYQFTNGQSLAQMRAKVSKGEAVV